MKREKTECPHCHKLHKDHSICAPADPEATTDERVDETAPTDPPEPAPSP